MGVYPHKCNLYLVQCLFRIFFPFLWLRFIGFFLYSVNPAISLDEVVFGYGAVKEKGKVDRGRVNESIDRFPWQMMELWIMIHSFIQMQVLLVIIQFFCSYLHFSLIFQSIAAILRRLVTYMHIQLLFLQNQIRESKSILSILFRSRHLELNYSWL